MPKFGKKSLERLGTLHPELQLVLEHAIECIDFSILCGFRGEGEQNKAFEDGRSKLKFPDSKHNIYPSWAVDIAPYPIDWLDIGRFQFLAGVVFTTAKHFGIELEWGGHWKNFKDFPHWQLK